MPDQIIECSTHGTKTFVFENTSCPYCISEDCYLVEEDVCDGDVGIANVECAKCGKDFEIHAILN